MGKALTDRSLNAMKPRGARYEVADGLLRGLYVVVQPSGVKSWVIRYRVAGKTVKFTLGTYPAVTLAGARDVAQARLLEVARGIDPAAVRRAEKAAEVAGVADAFEKVVERYVANHVRQKTRPRSQEATERAFANYITPTFKGRQVDAIRRRDVVRLLDEITASGKATTANRVYAAMSTFFGWCVEREIIETSPVVGARKPAEEKPRDRVLTDEELRLLLKAADKEEPMFRAFVRLLVLTGQRRDEVSGMLRSELDLKSAVWTIAASRAKNGVEHEVPLSGAAVAVIESVPQIVTKGGVADCVLTTTGISPISGYDRMKRRLDANILELMKVEANERGEDPEKIKPPERWVFHDLRRTCATGMAALGFPVTVVERCLNHKSGTLAGVAGVYNRHSYATEMRAALDAWARQVERIATGVVESNVVEMRGRRDG